MIDITLLGTGGTMPLKNRWLSSCLISRNGHSILIDCGEGTQIALKKTLNKFKPIDMICFTHFHADHISGLVGFLLSMGNEGRTEPVTLVGIKGLKYIVECLCVIAPELPFELKFIEIDYSNAESFMANDLILKPFAVQHSIECLGYSFELERSGKFDVNKAKKNNVPVEIWSELQKNKEVTFNGKIYTPENVLGKKRKGLKFTYCTDTRPTDTIISNAKNSDLFVCEGMFGEDEKLKRAIEAKHMLFSEAALLAKKAEVKQMWLTHFSPSLSEPEQYIDIAKNIFENTECGFDGKTVTLCFSNKV